MENQAEMPKMEWSVKIEPNWSEDNPQNPEQTESHPVKEEGIWIKPEPTQQSETFTNCKQEEGLGNADLQDDSNSEESTEASILKLLLKGKKKETAQFQSDKHIPSKGNKPTSSSQKASQAESSSEKPTLKLPIKRRKPNVADVVSDEEGVPPEKHEQTSSNKNPDQPNQDKTEYSLMYSYEITKNIQIVVIDEEERQIEHKETMGTRRHMSYMCEHCAVGFVVEKAFMAHMKVHAPESGDHLCDICHTYLKSADMLYRHRLRHYRRYRCLVCTTRFKDKDTAMCHVMTIHERQAFNCEHCGRGFKRPQYLKRHVAQRHTKLQQLECSVCRKIFHEPNLLRSHLRTHDEEVKTKTVRITVTCDVCSRNFHTKASLRRHLATHEDNTSCQRCRHKANNRNEMAQHYLNVHNEVYKV